MRDDMMKKKYIFNAVFSYNNDGISISYPDLSGCISCGFTQDEALQMAREALILYLEDMDENEISIASDISTIEIDEKNQKIFTITVEI